MMRLLLLPLFLFTLSMACMGQTFQYSRGWTNGKRALNPAASPLLGNGGHFHRSNELGYTDLYDLQDWSSERRLERCLSQLQRSLIGRNCAPGMDLNRVGDADSGDNAHLLPRLNGNLNGENVLYSNINSNSNRHRQSNELLEELSAAASSGGGSSSSEPNVFGKH
ncbi:hypothetical protein KR038_002153 [Drosophila bunnanda]|nr:hypothetical protein KR038_002153 [Drosophila bunnanda]